MTILHIIAGLPRAGGMSELVPLLALEQQRFGHDVTVATVGTAAADTAHRAESGGVTVGAYPAGWPRALYYSRRLHHDMPALVADADVVHVHGCWTFPVWWGCRAALRAGKPLVRSPHGCLDPERLAISRWKKMLAGGLFERRYFRRSAVILATCEAERKGIGKYVWRSEVGADYREGSRARKAGPEIVVVPNGIELEAFGEKPDRAALEWRWPGCAGKRVVLFLSRLHPIKGADLLVEAWGAVKSSPWQLLIAGPDEVGTLKRLREQVKRLGLDDSVVFCGPLYGEERARALASADLFVLPTRNENFGIVVAEALASGTPVITTKGAPWPELLGRTAPGRCGWWVEVGAEPLAGALKEAMGLTDNERQALGMNGRRLVEAKYRWPVIAKAMERIYEDAVDNGIFR